MLNRNLTFLIALILFFCTSHIHADELGFEDPVFLINLGNMKNYRFVPENVIEYFYHDDLKNPKLVKQWIFSEVTDESNNQYFIIAGYEPVKDQNGNWYGKFEVGLQGRVFKLVGRSILGITGTEVLFSDEYILEENLNLSAETRKKLILDYIEKIIDSIGYEKFKEAFCSKPASELDIVITSTIVEKILETKKVFPCIK